MATSYVPVASDAAEPVDGRMAGSAAREFRTLKAYLGGLVGTVNSLNTRVTTLEGGGGGGGIGLPFVSAEAYGVVADGTDKSAELQLAINAAKSVNGICFLPPGRIGIATLGVQSGNVRLQGFGDTSLVGSFIYTNNDFPASADTLTPLTRTSPHFYSDGVSYESTGDFALQLTAQEQPNFLSTATIRNGKFYGAKGLKMTHMIGFTVMSCEFNNVIGGTELNGCVNGTFIGNRWQNQAHYGVWIKSAGGFRNGGENMRFVNCEWDVCVYGMIAEKHMWLTVTNCLFDYCDLPVYLSGSHRSKFTQSYFGASNAAQARFAAVPGYSATGIYGVGIYVRPDATGNFVSGVHCTDCEFIVYINNSTNPIVYVDGYIDAGHPNSVEDVKFLNNLLFVAPNVTSFNAPMLMEITNVKDAQIIGNTFQCYNQGTTLANAYRLNSVLYGLGHSNNFYLSRVSGNIVGSSWEKNLAAVYISASDPGAVGAGSIWAQP